MVCPENIRKPPSRRVLLRNASAVGVVAGLAGPADSPKVGAVGPPPGPVQAMAGSNNAFSRQLSSGSTVELPLGVTLITDGQIATGGPEFIPGAHATILGKGRESVLLVRRMFHPSFAGLSIQHSGVTFRDLTLEVDVNGGSWCAAVALAGAASDLKFERVVFRGVGNRTGVYGVTCLFKDFSKITFVDCHFENLDFGFVKAMSDPSSQYDIVALRCTAEDCTEVFEFNSPGIFEARLRTGDTRISDISTTTTHLRIGMRIRSPGLPAACIEAIESGTTIITDVPATMSGVQRCSVGSIRGIVIKDLKVRRLSQWAIGLANSHNFDLNIYGEDCDLDLVHIEDHSSYGRVSASGQRCNLKPGQVGSSGADNGAVLVITGSHDVRIELDDFDLSQSLGGRAAAVCIQNGIAGTTNRDDRCVNITVSGRVRAGPRSTPIIAQHTRVVLDDFVVVAPDGAFPAADVRLLTATASGQVRRVTR